MIRCAYCDMPFYHGDGYYQFEQYNICEKCVPDHLVKVHKMAVYPYEYIIHGCRAVPGDVLCVEITTDEDAEFFGVYKHFSDGTEDHVDDFYDRESAECFVAEEKENNE